MWYTYVLPLSAPGAVDRVFVENIFGRIESALCVGLAQVVGRSGLNARMPHRASMLAPDDCLPTLTGNSKSCQPEMET